VQNTAWYLYQWLVHVKKNPKKLEAKNQIKSYNFRFEKKKSPDKLKKLILKNEIYFQESIVLKQM
jgi:hypothetical protein